MATYQNKEVLGAAQNTEAGGLQVQGQSGPYIITLKMLTIPTLSDTKTRQHTHIQAIHQYTDEHRCRKS